MIIDPSKRFAVNLSELEYIAQEVMNDYFTGRRIMNVREDYLEDFDIMEREDVAENISSSIPEQTEEKEMEEFCNAEFTDADFWDGVNEPFVLEDDQDYRQWCDDEFPY